MVYQEDICGLPGVKPVYRGDYQNREELWVRGLERGYQEEEEKNRKECFFLDFHVFSPLKIN